MSGFPYIYENKSDFETLHTMREVAQWVKDHKLEIDDKLDHFGAILFKNFPVNNLSAFEQFTQSLAGQDFRQDYVGGTSPRDQVASGIYNSTKMPFFMKIPMHSEMAYRKNFPKKLIFYCQKAPLLGGETPIADTRKVLESLSKELVQKTETHGITYYRILKNQSIWRKLVGKLNPLVTMATWQHVFQTNDKHDVDSYCDKNGYKATWYKNQSVLLQTTLPAVKKGEQHSWFNSIHFFQVHSKIWGRFFTFIARVFIILGVRDLSARTGNNQKLTAEETSQIVDSYNLHGVKNKWNKGDVLLLNNTITAHGRNRYLGFRKVYVSMLGSGNSEFID